MSTPFLRAAVVAAAFLPFLPSLCQAAPLTLERALVLAVQRSEAARAGRSAAASARAGAVPAGQLPDPVLRLGVDNLPATGADRFRTGRESMTMTRIGFSQEWLSADKRAAREAAALAMADREAVLAAAAEAETRLQTALGYVDAWYAGQALRLAILTEHHLQEAQDAARARLATAAASSAEVLALGAQLGVAQDERDDARQQQSAAWVSLSRWIGEAPEAAPNARADAKADAGGDPADAASDAMREALAAVPPIVVPDEASFVARHPGVVALQRERDVALRAVAVAAKERDPNWTWEVAYGQRTGYSDMVSVGVSIPLQVAPSRRQDRELAARQALVDKAEADLEEATRAATADYRAWRSDAIRLQQRIARYGAAVTAPARQRTVATLAAYRSNQASLSAVFEARQAEVEAQRKLLSLQRSLARAQVQLAYKPIDGDTP